MRDSTSTPKRKRLMIVGSEPRKLKFLVQIAEKRGWSVLVCDGDSIHIPKYFTGAAIMIKSSIRGNLYTTWKEYYGGRRNCIEIVNRGTGAFETALSQIEAIHEQESSHPMP